MSVVDKKKKVFGKIGAYKTLTQGLPQLKLSSSFSSVNNNGDVISFLTDLVKSLVGYEALVSSVVDTITHILPRIEKEVKKALKLELKTIVSCGVDPSIPYWMKSTALPPLPIVIELKKIDFANILRTDPNSVAGKLLYNDITTPLYNSSDFNTFLYGVIQDDGVSHYWKNILEFTFNSVSSGNPNNTLTIKAHPSYDNKTLTDLNNDFIDSLILFNTENIINKVMDIIYGTVSSNIGKSLKQLESEAKINTIIDKMVNNNNQNNLNDSAFSFSNDEILQQQLDAVNRKKGISSIVTSTIVPSSVPISNLTDFTQNINSAQTIIEKKDIVKNSLDKMAASSTANLNNLEDIASAKLNFIQQIITSLIKSIINMILSPKVIVVFILNFKIVYGPDATFTDGVDFIKKNKNLMSKIMKVIAEEIIKILLNIALKEIGVLVSSAMAKKQKEKGMLKLSQLQSLVGIPSNIIKKLLENLI